MFVNNYRYIPGFSTISVSDFYKNDKRIISSIDDFIQILQSQSKAGLPDEIVIDIGAAGEDIEIEQIENIRNSIREFNS